MRCPYRVRSCYPQTTIANLAKSGLIKLRKGAMMRRTATSSSLTSMKVLRLKGLGRESKMKKFVRYKPIIKVASQVTSRVG